MVPVGPGPRTYGKASSYKNECSRIFLFYFQVPDLAVFEEMFCILPPAGGRVLLPVSYSNVFEAVLEGENRAMANGGLAPILELPEVMRSIREDILREDADTEASKCRSEASDY